MRTSIRNTSSNTAPSSILNSAVTSFTSALLSTLVYYFVKALTQLEGLLKSVISVAGRRLFGCGYFLLLVSGCASYGVVENTPKSPQSSDQEYSLKDFGENRKNNDIFLELSFSGGGTRAAAMAYGIMQELRDTTVMLNHGSTRLLDEVDTISSVSGGSFTAAYYGLHGDGIFDTYEDVFLRKNVQKPIVNSFFNPLHWFSSKGRTERAVDYYQKNIFKGATYADMMKPGRPMIVINASDLAYGVRFSFVQEYFDFLCSDLRSFPVARAVAASSAVPVAFNPVVVENYSDCSEQSPEWLEIVAERARTEGNLELASLTDGLESYLDKDQRKYIHFVDGGITDNIGLRAFYDILELLGGPRAYLSKTSTVRPDKWVVIVVNASTTPVYTMDESNKQPSIEEAMSAMSGVQLHRYNAASVDLVQSTLNKWTDDLSTPEAPLASYFIEVSLADVKDSPLRQFFNMIPTSFFLKDEQIDKLIEAGRQLLRDNPDFQRFLADINKS